METLEEEEEEHQQWILVPTELIEDILSRLQVKCILRSRSVSKQWLSLISNPSFSRLHFTHSTRTALCISAYDNSTRQHHLLSASCDGGPVTHLLTTASDDNGSEVEHLNGLVLFTVLERFVVNPSTRKFFKLPDPSTHLHHTDDTTRGRIYHLFGFDESRNEHKVLMIRDLSNHRFEFMIFSMSTYSWRNIDDAQPPIGFTWDRFHFYIANSVCVNSVIHLLVWESLSLKFHILAFDLRTHMFSVINTPQVVSDIHWDPFFFKINASLAFVFYDKQRLVETNELNIWILQDYENRVWFKQVITFPEPWVDLGCPLPQDSIDMDKIIFRSTVANEDVRTFVYDKKSRCFKSLQFTSGHLFPVSTTLQSRWIRSYVESVVPL